MPCSSRIIRDDAIDLLPTMEQQIDVISTAPSQDGIPMTSLFKCQYDIIAASVKDL